MTQPGPAAPRLCPATASGRTTIAAVSAVACLLLGPGRAADAAAADPRVIAEAEQRFASDVANEGIGHGFLAHLAETAVVMTPKVVPARPLYEAYRDDGRRLIWRPDVAAISEAGDFGWSSGPWLSFAVGETQASGSGHYFTLWRHTPDAGWRAIFDGGVDHPVAASERAALPEVVARPRKVQGRGAGVDAACEQVFFADWLKKGRAYALREHAARDVRLLAPGTTPVDGRDALGLDALAGSPLAATRVARRLASDSGDIYVAYGEYELGIQGVYGRRHYAFVAVFDAADHCRLALELTAPLPAGGATAP